MAVGVPGHVVESDFVRAPEVLDIFGGVRVRR